MVELPNLVALRHPLDTMRSTDTPDVGEVAPDSDDLFYLDPHIGSLVSVATYQLHFGERGANLTNHDLGPAGADNSNAAHHVVPLTGYIVGYVMAWENSSPGPGSGLYGEIWVSPRDGSPDYRARRWAIPAYVDADSLWVSAEHGIMLWVESGDAVSVRLEDDSVGGIDPLDKPYATLFLKSVP